VLDCRLYHVPFGGRNTLRSARPSPSRSAVRIRLATVRRRILIALVTVTFGAGMSAGRPHWYVADVV
jgi:hypothetical protein